MLQFYLGKLKLKVLGLNFIYGTNLIFDKTKLKSDTDLCGTRVMGLCPALIEPDLGLGSCQGHKKQQYTFYYCQILILVIFCIYVESNVSIQN